MTDPSPVNPASVPSTAGRFGDIIARIYPDLRRVAAAKAASVGASPSSLAQETVCRLISLPRPPETDDAALALGCRLMEWTRVDRLRSDLARRKREQAANAPAGSTGGGINAGTEAARLAEALGELQELSPRKAEVLMLAAICRMSQERIAQVLEISTRTVQRDLEFATTWLSSRMRRSEAGPTPPGRNDADDQERVRTA